MCTDQIPVDHRPVGRGEGSTAGMTLLETAAGDPRPAGHHRVHAVRAQLLRATGRQAEAAGEYRVAAKRTLSIPERQYLLRRAALTEPPRHDVVGLIAGGC
jgi:predicted RNA polymerase sigma factor